MNPTRNRARLAAPLAFGLTLVVTLGWAASAFAVDPAVKKQAKDPDSMKRSDAARLLAKEGTVDAAEILADLLVDKNPYVRDLTALRCEDLKDAAAIDVIAGVAKSKDVLARRNAATALGRTKSDAALPHLEKLARKDASPLVRAEAFDSLWGYAKNPVALGIASGGLEDADPYVRAAAVEAIGRIGTEAAPGLVARLLTDPDEGVRCVAMMEMRFVARDEALAKIVEWAKSPGWRTRAQVVEDAAWMREAPAMEALVLLVGDPVLRVSSAAHRALVQISGKELGRDADLWKGWWDANKATWKAPHGKLAPSDEVKDPKATTSYHGVELGTDRAAFVIDFSGSMRDPISKSDTRVRWDVAKKELTDTVTKLPDGFLANVVLFSLEPKTAFAKAQPVTKKVRDDMLALLQGGPSHSGNLLDGVLTALADDQVDTIFLLSDGAPSAGDHTVKERVRWQIRQRNRMRKVAIHCIGFGATSATERSFLEDVAHDSGARCVYR